MFHGREGIGYGTKTKLLDSEHSSHEDGCRDRERDKFFTPVYTRTNAFERPTLARKAIAEMRFFCGIVRSPKYAQDYRVGCFDVRCRGFALSNELLYMICFHYLWRLMTAKRRYHHDRIPHIRAVNH